MSSRHACIAAITVVLALGACNSPAGGGTPSQPAGGGSSQAAGGGSSQAAGGGTSSQAAGGGGGAGADAATLNPCTMLSASDIQGIVGWSVDAGKLQISDGQSDCEWSDPSDDSHGFGLTIANYDDTIWQAGASSAIAKAVSGLGDAAYEGWPTAQALSIKIKGYDVSLGVADFAKTDDQIHAEDEVLAKLVLPKL